RGVADQERTPAEPHRHRGADPAGRRCRAEGSRPRPLSAPCGRRRHDARSGRPHRSPLPAGPRHPPKRRRVMFITPEEGIVNRIYNITEIVGSSPESSDQAVANAVAEASRTLRNLEWFEVQSVRGKLDEGTVAHWQVTVKVGFRHEP